MEVAEYIRGMGERARAAAVSLARLSTGEKNAVLAAVADALEARRGEIAAANAEDVKNAKAAGISPSMVDRLTHNAFLINMNGESYRLKETRKFNAK